MESMIEQLPLPVFWMIIAFLVATTAIFAAAGFKARRQVADIKATPTSNIGMATPGYVEFEGTTEAANGLLLTAPLTRSPCVWFHAKVEKWASKHKSETAQWSTLRDEASMASFLLRDATGVVVVHPWGADVTPSDRSVWYGGRPEPDDRSPARVAPADWSSPAVEVAGGPQSKYRFTEERIYADVSLLVLGEFYRARPEPDRDDEADDDLEDDAPVDDDIEMDEPSEVAGAWDDEALAGRIDEATSRVTNAVVSKGSGKRTFILSTTLQAVHVAQQEMGSQAALSLAPAPLLIAAFLLWVRFM